ncbi:type I-E CRISPR-associated protein Cas6/Cse3/CasE [Streptomyces sp. NPDC090025]|uniref:type I-E CRISPR-associated protein Cas6/Cse3/CasE n=1 Tax=Streptomyces sp. NPDC090025 TaxID=3365922 RepID=UPI003839CD27
MTHTTTGAEAKTGTRTGTDTAPPSEQGADDARLTGTWLTLLRLNLASKAVQYDLRDAAALHRRVMSLVPDGLGDSPRARSGLLFRLDQGAPGAPALLVQTRTTPDLERLPADYAHARTKSITPLLDALRPGLGVHYRLLGNAVKRCGRNSTEGRWKQALTLYGPDAEAWWTERADKAGLTLHTLQSDACDTLTAWHGGAGAGRADRTAVHHKGTRFEGTATIRDADALRQALLHGIGRAKSYGCGLLSLAPAHPAT